MELTSARWRTGSYSGGNGGNCVEVAAVAGKVLVRDTTDRDGVVLTVEPAAWRDLAARLDNTRN